jgi:hypothetical protein
MEKEITANPIHFTIPGHPVGYTRTTQGTTWTARYQKYTAYRNAVMAAFREQCPGEWGEKKPLTTTEKSRTHVSIKIYFKNRIHCDPDNCFKAIADSLFECDKYVSGDFDFDYDPINPRVEVILR